MAVDRIEQLRLLMQTEHLQEDPIKADTLKGEDAQQQVKHAPIGEYTAGMETVPVPQPVGHNDIYGGSSSSDNGYAVRRSTVSKPKKHFKQRQPHILADILKQDEQSRATGDIAPKGMGFVPILAAAKYPYKFLSASSKTVEEVSWGFFAAEKFWQRRWTVYFIYPPSSISIKPLHLVPSTEVEALLEQINKELNLSLKFPLRAAERGFYLDFPEDGQPRPQFLGISASKATFNIMEKQTPAEGFSIKGTEFLAQPSDDRSYAAFRDKMESAVLAIKAKAKASKEKKKFEKVQQKNSHCRQLRRTQRYLGIRPRSTTNIWSAPDPPSYDVPGQSWADYVKAKEEYDQQYQQKLPVLDHHLPTPYPFEQNVVFVCIDVEAYERSHGLITEIGISSLDANDIQNIAPGVQGVNWMAHIKSRHFRIKEHMHLVNKDFIVGCPDRFEKAFGESEFVTLKGAPQAVASCFRPPFAARTSFASGFQDENKDIKRNILLVGHDTKTDINYLRELGYDVRSHGNILEVLDTASLYRAMKYESQSASLGMLLCDLGLMGWNLHNAGNDAAYTLQALIGIAFKSLNSKQEREVKDLAERKAEAGKEAAERVAEDYEEWGVAEGHDDGGPAEYNIELPKDHAGSTRGRGGSRGAGDRGKADRGRGRTGRGSSGHQHYEPGSSSAQYPKTRW